MKNAILRRIASTLSSLVLIMAVAGDCLAADPTSFRRWAVVGDTATRDSGLSDLVAAELAQWENVELVEREELQRAIQELELSQLHTAAELAGRLQLGALMNADALLLLSFGNHDGKSFVRAVTCDCVSGARLAYEQFAFSEPRIDELADQVTDTVSETLARFPSGVQRLVTVSPFLSKDFSHDFDHLQNACAAWLSEVIAQQPGLAVVELAEARAIREELSITGSELSDRQRPLFIVGGYSTERVADSNSINVRLSISARDREQVVLSVESEALKLDLLPDWLHATAGSKVLEHLKRSPGNATGISRTEQAKLLSERADRFARFGAYDQSIALREAALLLERNTDREMTLVEDYQSLLKDRYDEASDWLSERYRLFVQSSGTEEFVFPETWDQRFEGDLKLYRAMIPHCLSILGESDSPSHRASTVLRAMTTRLPDCRFVPERWQEAHEVRESAFWVAVSILSEATREEFISGKVLVPDVSGTSLSQTLTGRYDRWIETAITYIFRYRGNVALAGPRNEWRADDTLDALMRLLTESRLPNCPCVRIVRLCNGSYSDGLVFFMKYGVCSEEQLRDLQTTLSRSNDPVWKIYGACLADSIEWNSHDQKHSAVVDSRIDRLKQISRQIASLKGENELATAACRFAVVVLQALERDLQKQGDGQTHRKWPSTPQPVTGADPFPHLRFHQTGITTDWSHLTPCTSEFDIVWSFERVARLSADGKQKVLYDAQKQKDQVRQVVWDDRYLWIGTRSFGVRIFTTDGDVLAEIPQGKPSVAGEPALPEWEPDNMGDGMTALVESTSPQHAFRLFNVSPGRCLVTGRYGKQARLWIALLEYRNERCEVHVLHEAALRADGNVHEEPGIEEACEPNWFLPVPPQPGKPVSQVLMGRGLINKYSARRLPMLIDMNSKQVSLFDGEAPVKGAGWIRLTTVIGQSAIVQDGDGFNLLTRDAHAASGWRSQLIRFRTESSRRHQSYSWPLATDHGVYFPGPIWRRLDLDTGLLKTVTPEPLSNEWTFDEYAASGPLGLVAWNRGDKLLRINARPDPAQVPTLDERYPFVPTDQRIRHHEAVTRLRELGATIESSWGSFARAVFQRRNGKEWRTVAWFPESWTGDTSDFALLKDVYNVRELLLVGAPITDADCETIGQLKQLQHLTFEQTQVTDQGLSLLGSLPHLAEVRLQGRPDQESFTDKAMSSMAQLPSLERLIIFGSGFSNKAMLNLPKTRSFHRLCLLDTAIDDSAIAIAKSSVRNLSVKRHMAYNRL
ncbi:MAG: hypothetical protein O2945_07485 [Planctomycetota bacterium]|nr:hypothetical protein [Planctomycetota bacterium]MDA0918894.1 hypothetical protein [Planctomycetota bacterium]